MAHEIAGDGRTYGGLSAGERSERRRRRLIEAAIELFGHQGYPAVSIDALCARSGVSSRNFYDHFAGKEDLLLAVYDQISREAQQAILAAVAATPPEPEVRARAGLEAFIRVMLENESRARINFVEVVGVSQRVEARRRQVIRDFAAILEAGARELEERAIIEPRPRLFAVALIGAVQETLSDWVSSHERPPLQEVVDTLVRLYVAAGKA